MKGKKAPAFKSINQKGEKVSLADFKGKYLVLYFYPRDNTPGCTAESCRFNELKDKFSEQGAVILGASADSPESHQKFIDKFDFKFDLLSDESKELLEKYGAWGEKLMFGKKKMGVIRSTLIIGPDGKVLHHWDKVKKAAEHPDEVLEILKALKEEEA